MADAAIADRSVEACSDSSGAEIDLVQKQRGLRQARAIFFDHHRVGAELLPERHRNSILQLSPAHFQHISKLERLARERLLERAHGVHQRSRRTDRRDIDRRRVGVVGGLAEVDMIIGVELPVVTFAVPQDLERPVCDHFVGIHVRGRTRTSLDDVDHELVV